MLSLTEDAYLVGVNKPLSRGCLECLIAIRDNVFRGAKVVTKDGLLSLRGTIQSGFLAPLRVFW